MTAHAVCRTKDSFQLLREHLRRHGHDAQCFLAFMGDHLGLSAVEPAYRTHRELTYMPAWRIGAFLSMLGLWRALWMKEGKDEWHWIVQEDARFTDGAPTLDEFMKHAPGDAQFVFLGSCCTAGKVKDVLGNGWAVVDWPMCLHSYLIRHDALQTFIERIGPANVPIDIATGMRVFSEVRHYTALPPLMRQEGMELPP